MSKKNQTEKNGCKYCNDFETLVNAPIFDKYQNEVISPQVFIGYGEELVLDIMGSKFDGIAGIERVSINYCPMCGRKFEHKESEDNG